MSIVLLQNKTNLNQNNEGKSLAGKSEEEKTEEKVKIKRVDTRILSIYLKQLLKAMYLMQNKTNLNQNNEGESLAGKSDEVEKRKTLNQGVCDLCQL